MPETETVCIFPVITYIHTKIQMNTCNIDQDMKVALPHQVGDVQDLTGSWEYSIADQMLWDGICDGRSC